jgi:hypothetical protein
VVSTSSRPSRSPLPIPHLSRAARAPERRRFGRTGRLLPPPGQRRKKTCQFCE